MGFENHLSSVKIERFCSLGSNIKVLSGDHPTKKFVSTNPAFCSDGLKKVDYTMKDM